MYKSESITIWSKNKINRKKILFFPLTAVGTWCNKKKRSARWICECRRRQRRAVQIIHNIQSRSIFVVLGTRRARSISLSSLSSGAIMYNIGKTNMWINGWHIQLCCTHCLIDNKNRLYECFAHLAVEKWNYHRHESMLDCLGLLVSHSVRLPCVTICNRILLSPKFFDAVVVNFFISGPFFSTLSWVYIYIYIFSCVWSALQ